MNWTIRNRLLAGCGVLVTVIAVACLLGWQQAATSEKRISGIIKGNQADLAQLEKVEASGQSSVAARNAELEFLLKKDPAFAQAVTSRISDIRKSLGSVVEETTDATQKQTAIHAIELAGRYESAFKNVSELLARRGLTPETGLEGELRKAAHEIEAAVKEQGIAELEIILVQCRRHEKDYLLRGDTKYMDEISKRIEEFGRQMTLFSLPEATKTRANACWKTYATAMRSIVDADQQIKTARTDCQQAAEQFQKEMQALSASTSATIAASPKNALRLMASGKSFMLILLVVGVILGGVVVLVLTRSITNPIRIAVESLTLSADHTASAAGQVSATSQSLAEGASEQAASLEETSASLEEISSMTQRNAQNVQSAKDFTAQTRATAESGAQSTHEMGQAMQGIRTASGEMRDAMNGIKAASNDVAKIIKTIDEIAFQTNILALNAAVEAARAGEAGMGFAVVADEVRNLAQRSAKAAKETADMIETSIKRSDDGVRVTDKVVSSVEEVAAKSQQLEQKLAEILAKAQKVDEQVAEIASASSEQSQGISEVNMAVSQMDKVTQSNASNAEESAAAAEELNAQAEVLKDAVGELQKLVGGSVTEPAANPKANAPTPAKFQSHGKTSKSQPKPGLIKSPVAPKPARSSNDRDFPMPEPIGAGSTTNGFKNF